ncbi:putative F-box/LRR-repeat protein [Cardamine amara subsp. amara]|uniref:F-box/LRR-repeat protein n=1 Tax=Cardamine amara subsp. amara TaxID=228776 RepID=A0ABD0Z5H6_CARAN
MNSIARISQSFRGIRLKMYKISKYRSFNLHSKKMHSGSKDFINDLPDALLCYILSYLTTKEAASTSLLSRRWRYLLAFLPNLEFDDSIFLHPDKRVKTPLHEVGFVGFVPWTSNKRMKLSTSFTDFVDRILDLQGNYHLHKFSLKMVRRYDYVDPDCVIHWIHKVLVRGVSDLQLVMDLKDVKPVPARIFFSQTLVRLVMNIRDGPAIDVADVHLPKLKTLHLESVMFKEEHIGFSKLLSGCHVLEELVLGRIWSCVWTSCTVSVATLKRLTSCCKNLRLWGIHKTSNIMSFDIPNLVYLEYAEVIADKYLKVNFDSLVEAKIDIWMTDRQLKEVRVRDNESSTELEDQFVQGDEKNNMVGNATDFIVGISNVRVLYLSADSLEVLTYCCKPIPIFNNLTHLTIKSNPKIGWESLPKLLQNSPNLETLVFQGLLYKATEKKDVATCLSSSPVKVIEIFFSGEQIEKQMEVVKHFLETMPHLEQLVLYYDSSFDGDVKVSWQLQMLTRVASPRCKVQLIPIASALSVSYTVPTSVSTK